MDCIPGASADSIGAEAARGVWEEKTKEILAKKLAFEEEMAVKKAQADANTNLSSIIDTLNAEISQFSQNTGIKKDSINKAEVLARIVDEIKSSVPTGANKLAELNSEVPKSVTAHHPVRRAGSSSISPHHASWLISWVSPGSDGPCANTPGRSPTAAQSFTSDAAIPAFNRRRYTFEN
jgi:hypothetical protein